MAVNLIANQLNAKVSIVNKTWSELGFNGTNIAIVYLLDPQGEIPIASWKPNEPFSQLTGIERNKGYLIQPLVDLDRSGDFAAPLPTTTTTTTTSSTTTSSTSSTSTSSTSSTTTSSTTAGEGGQTYTLTPPSDGYLVVDNSDGFYKCGDTIILQGTFKTVEFHDLNGCDGNPIRVTNPEGQITNIGDPAWSSGSWSTAMAFRNCHHVILSGTTQSNFVINGSVQSTRTAYFNLAIVGLSDNFEAYNITINNGGTGLYCKTEPVPGDTNTYDPVGGPYTYLNNFKIHDIKINGTDNEGTYIGHTGNYWDLTTNTQFNGNSSQFDPTHEYAEPKRLNNVQIYNMVVSSTGADGMQMAAIENLVAHHNEVFNYALKHNPNHSCGFLVGGKSKNYEVYCNYIHDGWGELCQLFGDGSGGSYFHVYNNLFENNAILGNAYDGVSVRVVNEGVMEFHDNTVVKIGGVALRVYSGTGHHFDRNALVEPVVNSSFTGPRTFIYDEPGTSWIEGAGLNSNAKEETIAAAQVDENNYYQPSSPSSPVYGRGYNRGFCTTGTTTTTSSTSTTSTSSSSTSSTSTTSTSTTSSTTTTTTTSSGVPLFSKVSGWIPSFPSQYGWLYLPAGYDGSGSTKYPFVVFLHGQGEVGSGSTSVDTLIDPGKGGPGKYFNAGDRPDNIVYFIPQLASSPGTWEPNWVEAARSYVVNNFNGDPNKFYLTGLSLGGSGTSKYVGTYPDRVAAYLIATGDTQWQRFGNEDTVVNGVRVADVPGYFIGGVADSIISVNNGVMALNSMNVLSPKPIYPYLVYTLQGKGHNNSLWDTEVYNRKFKTTGGGTASFDYILEYFLKYKANDLTFNATNKVILAEQTSDYTDYRIALRLVNLMTAGSDKTDLLNRLSAVKSDIDAVWRIIDVSLGSVAVSGNINQVNTSTINQATNDLIDSNGEVTSLGVVLTQQRWTPPSYTSNIDLKHEYYGFPAEFFASTYMIYDSPNTWRITGMDDGKSYKIRWYYGNISENTTIEYAINVTINGIQSTMLNEMVNTHRYLDTNATSTGGQLNISLESFEDNGEDKIYGFTIFETVAGGTTTTTTSSTSTTSTSSTSTSSTSSTSSSSTTSTSSTSTTSSTTTTTTTPAPAGEARFNFNNTAQSVSGWKDVSGNPSDGVITSTDTINGTGYTITSIAGKWGAFGGTSSNTNGGTGSNSDFPPNVMISYWFNYSYVYGSYGANLVIGNLSPNTIYTIKVIGSRSSTAGSGIPVGQNRLMEFYVSQVSTPGHESEQSALAYAARDSVTTKTFSIISNSGGQIYMGVFVPAAGNETNGDQFAYINGITIKQG